MTHVINGIQIFPSDNVWNRSIVNAPIHANSTTYISLIGGSSVPFLAEFSQVSTSNLGIPYNIVNNSTTTYMPTISPYASTSYAGPYPIPNSPLIEEPNASGSDKHLLCLNTDTGILYELDGATPNGSGGWNAKSGGLWNLASNTLPSVNVTYGDAASLPILAGLVLYDEVATGTITHALRCALPNGAGFGNQVWPARHNDGSTTGYPPEGSRFRLRASFDISGYSTTNQVILTALKTYGCFLADSGTLNRFKIFGMPDNRWSDSDVQFLNQTLTAADFEVVDLSSTQINANSAQAGVFSVAQFPTIARRGTWLNNYATQIVSDGAIAYYRLGESSGTIANDSTGNNHNGTIIGGVTLGQTGVIAYDTSTSMRFDGSSGYIMLPSQVNITGWTALTLECWFNLSVSANNPVLFSNDLPSSTHNGIELFFSASSQKVTFLLGNGTTSAQCFTSATFTTGTWYYIVATWNGSAIQLYANGVASGASVAQSGSIGTPGFQLNLAKPASYGSPDFFPGLVDEVAIYHSVLTPAQILNHYRLGKGTVNGGKTSTISFPPTKRRGA